MAPFHSVPAGHRAAGQSKASDVQDLSREIRAGNSSIHFHVIKLKSGVIGKSSVIQQTSISDREIWPERRDEITGGVCTFPK